MEAYIPVSYLNDFCYSPESLYFSGVYRDYAADLVHSTAQTRGKFNHGSIDTSRYATSKHWLQGRMFFCEKYNLCGRIDLFNTRTGELLERKTKVETIYPGHRYQLYAQLWGLKEQGYLVKSLALYSFSTNQKFPVPLPTSTDWAEFGDLIKRITEFDPLTLLDQTHSSSNLTRSIYRELGF